MIDGARDTAPWDEAGPAPGDVVRCRCGAVVRPDDSTHGTVCDRYEPATEADN